MATRDIGASIATALEDLLKERAIVDHAIQNLQGLLATMKGETAPAKRRGRPPGSGRKAAPTARATAPRATAKSAAKASSKSALNDAKAGWSEAARTRARERMRKYWEAKRQGAGMTSKAAAGATAAPRKKRGRPPKNREAAATSEG